MRKLNFYYYGIMALTVIVALCSYLLLINGIVSPIDPLSTAGMAIQYVIIFSALICIPLGLYVAKRQCDRLADTRLSDDHTILPVTDEMLQAYHRIASLRIVMVSHTMVWAIAAFYLMGAYQSMLWVAAVAAIGWYFTKPTEGKRDLELTPRSQRPENY